MNRRTFLKAFTGGVVGAGVLAYAPSKAVTVFEGNYSLYFADKIHPTLEDLERVRDIVWANGGCWQRVKIDPTWITDEYGTRYITQRWDPVTPS